MAIDDVFTLFLFLFFHHFDALYKMRREEIERIPSIMKKSVGNFSRDNIVFLQKKKCTKALASKM